MWNVGAKSALVVDDDPEVCALITRGLSQVGMNAITTKDGLEATKYVENQKFSVIILDINLPTMKGLQVADRARKSHANRQTPIYIISAFVESETLTKGKRIGVTAIIPKPFKLSELVSMIMAGVEPTMKAAVNDPQVIKCFIAGSVDVLKAYYSNVQQKIGAPVLKAQNLSRSAYASATIPFSSAGFLGSMVIGLPAPFIKNWIAKKFDPAFKIDHGVISSSTMDLGYQILESVQSQFAKIGITAKGGEPVISIGKDHEVRHSVNCMAMVVPVQFGDVGIELEFCLTKVDKNEETMVGA